ncbi:MAG TPA: hypothetical protein VHQ64_03325 [Pyrinomonadaceae bacterium]|jgi:hypothetical protein|nr:hypothetical protein [Pyrinomonadaceae bacterium]
MKIISRVVLLSLACLVLLPFANAKPVGQPIVTVPGVYENFTVGKGSGDLEGMRVVIVPAGDGYYAIVQVAQGGAEDPKPEFVAAVVKGKSVSFTAGEVKYTATVTATGMTVKDSSGQSQMLKRRACTTYFK